MYGRFNGQFSLDPKGLRPGEAILGGASYTVGPLVVGVQYLNYTSAGDVGNANAGRNRLETGVAAGATYSLAPGLSLFASYLYSERRQSGYDFITGQGVSAAAPNGVRFNNKVTSQILSIGTGFSW
jgi:predicted porin